MNYTLNGSTLESVEAPLLAVAVPKHDKQLPPALAGLDARSGGVLGRLCASGDFGGGRDETSLVYLPGNAGARVLLVGVGKLDAPPAAAGAKSDALDIFLRPACCQTHVPCFSHRIKICEDGLHGRVRFFGTGFLAY